LDEQPFAHWSKPSAVPLRSAHDITAHGLRLQAFDYTSEPGVDLRLWVLTAASAAPCQQMTLTVLDDAGWFDWANTLGPEFQLVIGVPNLTANSRKLTSLRRTLEVQNAGLALVVPRGFGPTRTTAEGTPAETQLRRRFALIGQTLDGQRVWDVHRALQALATHPSGRGLPTTIHGRGHAAGLALLAGLYEPSVQRFDLTDLPSDETSGPTFLRLQLRLGWPQLLALAGPRPVQLTTRTPAAWAWPLQVQTALGETFLQVRAVDE
jgi:hypothetical protein